MSGQRPGVDFQAYASRKKLRSIGRVILVGSGKGGVGKSLVACGLALALTKKGYRTGVFDLDVHGASVPNYLGVSPPVTSTASGLQPKTVDGLKAMSLALFTGDRPLPLRGERKQSLITQLFALTHWGRLDFLVVDLPPGTGDEVLSAFSLFAGRSELMLVTTPSRTALDIVARLARLAEAERVPVEGVVVNMAYSGGAGTRSPRSYPFGEPDKDFITKTLGSAVLVEVPLDPEVSSSGLLKVMESRRGIPRALASLASIVSRSRLRAK